MADVTPRRLENARRALWHLRHGGPAQLRTALRRQRSAGRGAPDLPRWTRDGRLTFAPWPVARRAPRRADLRVGVVLDDFSRLAFGYEWDQVLLEPASWRESLRTAPVDLLFVESAWSGNDGAWKYHLTGPGAPREAFRELVAYCRETGVPTVFWNKDDPAHLDDFLECARLFDAVLTSDSDAVPTYVEQLGHDRVGTLGFAAQPAIHNPVRYRGGGPGRDVAFAGMYFANRYPERREQMDLVLGAAHRVSRYMGTGLEIFSRQLGGEERYQFPAPFAARVVGSLTYEQMLTAYREYKVFLNVNSVAGSPSMCARRVFEISASGTPVVSAPSVAVERLFPLDEVFSVSEGAEAEHTIRALVRSKELRDRATHRAQRRIWSEHTYAHRTDEILRAAGLAPSPVRRRTVSALVATNRPGQVGDVLRTVAGQQGVRPQLVLCAHGFDVDRAAVAAEARDLGIDDLLVLAADGSLSLGACLNRLVEAADGEVVAKMDDDDLYGPHYLSDQLYALEYSGADVVGKHAHYMHLERSGATVLRFADREHQFARFVMGPTIVMRDEVARAVPFGDLSRGEDTAFLASLEQADVDLYAADRFNFVQVRRAEADRHTWTASDAEVLSGGEVQFYGRAEEHVFV